MSRLAGVTNRLGRSFAGAGTRATIDMSEIDELRRLLATASDRAEGDASEVLDKEVPRVFEEAHNTVISYPHATGETAKSMDYDRKGNTRRVWAETKQARLLEYGTPNTGPPRPWLTGPAERGSLRILRAMSDVGRVW